MSYNIKHNNYYQNPKPSNIYTPLEISQFIFDLLKDEVEPGIIFDPCVGKRSLLEPWITVYHDIFGIDNDEVNAEPHLFADFLSLEKGHCEMFFEECLEKKEKPALILCNPPFNGYKGKFAPEVWLDKIIELFGKEIPLVLFTPMGFRLNSRKTGKRWAKFTKQEYPPITSIISLPRDIFEGIEFHIEILIFNLPQLQPHYFYHEPK